MIEEDPYVSPVSRSRPLQRRRHVETAAGCEEGNGVFAPARLVESTARNQQVSSAGGDSCRWSPCPRDDLDCSISQRPQGSGLERDLLALIRWRCMDGLPIHLGRRRVAVLLASLPAQRVHISRPRNRLLKSSSFSLGGDPLWMAVLGFNDWSEGRSAAGSDGRPWSARIERRRAFSASSRAHLSIASFSCLSDSLTTPLPWLAG